MFSSPGRPLDVPISDLTTRIVREMARAHPESISPTAHYTGYVWYAHGQSHDAFATRTGRLMYTALRGANVAAHAVGLPTLEGMLVARHTLIDLPLPPPTPPAHIT